MAYFDTGMVRTIKWYHELQKVHININQHLKCMKHAYKSKYDYESFHEQGYGVLPFLCAWKLGFNCKRLLDVSGVYWNRYLALKHLVSMKIVLAFL